MRPAPSERDVAEARLLASRPDLLAQHVEVLRGVGDADAFRRTVDAALAGA